MVKLFIPEHARLISARGTGHKKKTGNVFAGQNRKHVSQRIQEAIVTGDEDGPWRKLSAVLDPGTKLLRRNDAVVSFEKSELLPEAVARNQVSGQKVIF